MHIDDALNTRKWLLNLRAPVEDDIQDIMDLMSPFTADINRTTSPDRNRISGCFDSTAMTAADALANFVIANVFPPTGDWLRFRSRGKEGPDVQDALDQAAEKLLVEYAQSNFYPQMGKFIRDLLLIGNAGLYVESRTALNDDDPSNIFGGFTFEAVPFGQFARYVDRNGDVLAAARDFVLSAFEVERQFGVTVDAAKFDPIKLSHIVTAGNGDRAYDSAFAIVGGADNQVVATGGHDFMPYIAARLEMVGDFQYGYGRGHLARPTAAGMNEARRLTLNAMGKDLDPPLVVEHDSVVTTARVEGGIITKKPDTDPLTFLRSGTDYSAADRVAREDQAEIARAFMSDLVLDPDTQPRSAEESRQRAIRIANRSAGIGVAISHGALTPATELTANIMMRDGALEELKEGGIDVEFVSPFFSLQRAAATQKLIDFAGLMTQLSSLAQDPGILDKADIDQIAEMVAENSDVPARAIRIEDDVQQRRLARNEAEAEAQFAQNASALAAVPQVEPNTPGLELS